MSKDVIIIGLAYALILAISVIVLQCRKIRPTTIDEVRKNFEEACYTFNKDGMTRVGDRYKCDFYSCHWHGYLQAFINLGLIKRD